MLSICKLFSSATFRAIAKSASNWSTYADNIYPIVAYPVTNFETITDSWSQIIASIDDGSYSTKYAVGDTKKININNVDVYAQIVAQRFK